MSAIIRATLVKAITYTDFHGNVKTLPAGHLIEVVQIRTAHISTAFQSGKPYAEKVGSFIGVLGHDSFDLETNEFKTID